MTPEQQRLMDELGLTKDGKLQDTREERDTVKRGIFNPSIPFLSICDVVD